jgi:phosphodiesterase/alkaline phosphatase D-like protein
VPSIFPDGDLDDAVELGSIDDRSVRVWLRMADHPSITATLESPGLPAVSRSISLSGDTDWTGVIVLAHEQPPGGAPFTVSVGDQRREGRFAPTPGLPAALTFGFGSCHMPYAENDDGQIVVRQADAAIYPAIRDDLLRAGGQFLLLAGDQIYADELEPISVRRAFSEFGTDGPPDAELLSRYRRNYHGFFNQSGFRSLRETFPTLCIWDDHDIYDNWGSTGKKLPTDLRLFEAARQAYTEYQHARNPSGDRGGPPFHWLQQWGDIAIIALDVRGARDYERGVMAGPAQWEWLLSWLAGDASRNVSTVFITSSVPVAHTARWFTLLFDRIPTRFKESIRDRWSSAGFIDSRNQLLDALFRWEASAPHRQVVILSGDVHCASAFTIRQRNGPGVIHQVTSSAMTTPLSFEQKVFNQTVVHGTNLFERDYRFERHFLSLPNNYGGIRVEPLPEGGHRMIVAIRSWDPKRRRLRTTGRLVTTPED